MFCSLKVPMDNADKDSKPMLSRSKNMIQECQKWCLILNEPTKNNGYARDYDMIMSLGKAMLVGHILEAFLMERRSQEAKNRICKAK
jgi:hypothetical protein